MNDNENRKTPEEPQKAPPKAAKSPYRLKGKGHIQYAKALQHEFSVNLDGKVIAPVYDEGAFYRYDPVGIWARISEEELARTLERYDRTPFGKHVIHLKAADLKGALWCLRGLAWSREFFTGTSPGLPFRDAFVYVTGEGEIGFRDHSPEHLVRFAYDFPYTEEEPALLLDALRGMFKPDDDGPEKVQLVGEFAGVCLLGAATRLQQWLLLKGPGEDGKSTLLELITGCFPTGSTCSIRPERLENEYDRADLCGKLLNTVSEVNQREVLDSVTLKAITTGDKMRGRPIREKPIEFKPIAGHILASNEYPRFADSSHGFWRRPLVLTFNRRFTGDPARVLGLAEKVLATERPQMVSWLIRTGAKALARGAYTIPASHPQAIDDWRAETDPIYEFVKDRLSVTLKRPVTRENGWTPIADLYGGLTEWAEKRGFRAPSMNAFGRRLNALGHLEGKVNGKRYRPLRLLKDSETNEKDGGG